MLTILVVLGFVFLAAFFNSVMDATENEPNFNESILRNLDKKFWLKTVSWEYARKLFGYKFDAWHLAKTGMVFSLAGAIISAAIFGMKTEYLPAVNWAVLILSSTLVVGVTWNVTFKLFYHIIFKVK